MFNRYTRIERLHNQDRVRSIMDHYRRLRLKESMKTSRYTVCRIYGICEKTFYLYKRAIENKEL